MALNSLLVLMCREETTHSLQVCDADAIVSVWRHSITFGQTLDINTVCFCWCIFYSLWWCEDHCTFGNQCCSSCAELSRFCRTCSCHACVESDFMPHCISTRSTWSWSTAFWYWVNFACSVSSEFVPSISSINCVSVQSTRHYLTLQRHLAVHLQPHNDSRQWKVFGCGEVVLRVWLCICHVLETEL